MVREENVQRFLRYHFPVHNLADRLLKTIRKQELIEPGDRVAAAVSGGADSVALLLLLLDLRAELGIVLSVAHVNHKLRGEESEADEKFVADLAKHHDLELHSAAAPLRTTGSGIEAAARELRYGFFRKLARESRVSKIATAHTLDDQAETVLLRILRGTGIRGLSGIHPRLPLSEPETASTGHIPAEVIRPLLAFRRDELRDFLRQRSQLWREDSTNRDLGFLRNRVRHEILPLLNQSFSGQVADNLSDLAEIARVEEEHWGLAHPEIRATRASLDLTRLLSLPLVSQRRLVMNWIETHASNVGVSLRLVEEILAFAQSSPGKMFELASGYSIRRTRGHLCLESPSGNPSREGGYEHSFSAPGRVEVPELGIRIETAIVDPNTVAEAERDCLLDLERLPRTLALRNWRPGDRFWPAHTKEARKVKDLLNDRHITGPEKKLWPVITAGAELVWLRGFPIPTALQPSSQSSQALRIREVVSDRS